MTIGEMQIKLGELAMYARQKGWDDNYTEAVNKVDECVEELQAHREAWEKCIKEIKEWYWNADKQAIAKDPCVVDAIVDLFIRTIKECRPKEGDTDADSN